VKTKLLKKIKADSIVENKQLYKESQDENIKNKEKKLKTINELSKAHDQEDK
jgi:hypothetical protein